MSGRVEENLDVFVRWLVFFGSFLETGFILFIIRGGLGEELDIVIRVVVDCF